MTHDHAIVHEHHHSKRHKSLPERYQTAIACTIAVALIFGLVFGIGLYVPMAPLASDAAAIRK